MRKLLCTLTLFAAIGVMMASVAPSTVAQQKKDEKKDDKKDPKKDDKKDDKKDPKKDEPGSIEVYQGKDGWRYRVLGPDGKIIAIGIQGFAKKEDCLAVVDVLKTTLEKAKVTEIKDKK